VRPSGGAARFERCEPLANVDGRSELVVETFDSDVHPVDPCVDAVYFCEKFCPRGSQFVVERLDLDGEASIDTIDLLVQ